MAANEALLFAVETSMRSIEFANMSEPQKAFFLIWCLESEVNNGGFLQFFGNSSGRYAPQVIDALTAIGAHRCRVIAEEAINLIPLNAAGWHDDARRTHMVVNLNDDIKGQLDMIDTRFYSYPDDLSHLLAIFVTAHQTDFNQ